MTVLNCSTQLTIQDKLHIPTQMDSIDSLHLPQDVAATLTSPPSSAISSSSSQQPPSQTQIVKLTLKLKDHPNDITTWDALISEYTRVIDTSHDPMDPTSVSSEIKDGINTAYRSLLGRFPYLEEYWKSWLILTYKLSGTEASIKILEAGVENCSNSITLWTEYLSAQIAVLNSERSDDDVEKIRRIYRDALDHVGYHFNSHPVWDKIFEFENTVKKDDGNSKEVLKLYSKVSQIPLYQYAQYYNQFTEICKSYDILDIVPTTALKGYLEKFEKGKPEHLSLIEKHQIIDDYTYMVFSETQAKVNSNWQYESSLEYQQFTITKLKEVQKEKDTWMKYIDHEQDIYTDLLSAGGDNKEKITHHFNLVKNLYERCLVPNCFDWQLWVKYIKFLNILHLLDDQKFQTIKNVYLKACSKFIPVDKNRLRFLYVKFLLKHEKFEDANEYLFDWMKYTSGNGSAGVYYKSSYLETIKEVCALWSKLLDRTRYVEICDKLIVGYFDKIDRYTKKQSHQSDDKGTQHTPSAKKVNFELSEVFISLFSKFLNDESICIIVNSYLNNLTKSNATPTEVIRKFFNQYHTQPAFAKSVQFWKFYYEYETIHDQNIHNARFIINYILHHTQLPKAIIDHFVEWNYEVSSANLIPILSDNDGSSDPMLITRDLDIANSVYYNKSSWKRLARNNTLVREGESKQKQQHGGWKKEEELVRVLSRHIGHPGIMVDATPDITNKFMNDGNEVDLTNDNLEVPPLPSFKNVERASLAINYPKE